jgi:hypothetical protein
MYEILVYMLLKEESKVFGKTVDLSWFSYMYALLEYWNYTSGMPSGIPRCRGLNQVSYIKREFLLLEQELSLRLRIC